MDANVGINDKFKTRKPDSFVRDLSLGKCLFRDADIHHDVCLGLGHLTEINALDFKIQETFVDLSLFTLCAGDSDLLTCRQLISAVLSAHNASDA